MPDNTFIELSILEAVLDENEAYANRLVMGEMTSKERAVFALQCSTIIRMCMGTWEEE